MIDLWQLLVEGVFQSFWMSIAGLSMIYFLMFMFAKVSPATAGYFILLFLFSMCIGYGYLFYAILIWIFFMAMALGAGTKLINSMGIGG